MARPPRVVRVKNVIEVATLKDNRTMTWVMPWHWVR
jgi:hypothetical protein